MSTAFDRTEIKKILPHREPFLFVDEVLEVVPGEKITGLVRDDSGTYLIQDESGESYFPPTLLAEAMAQVGAVLVLHSEENRGRTIFFRPIKPSATRSSPMKALTFKLPRRPRIRRTSATTLTVEPAGTLAWK